MPNNSLETAPQEPFEYNILTGHHLPNGSYRSGEKLRMDYLTLTDGLIHKMTDGVEVRDPVSGEVSKQVPDVVVWLDKSARPLAWLTKDLWPKMAADPETGEVPKIPDFKFVNIDREQWVNKIDPEGVGTVDIGGIDRSIIRSLRSIFVEPKHKQEGLTSAIDDAPSYLDDKVVMIVDETRSEGKTLRYSQEFFKAAFPSAQITGAYWTTRKYRTADGSEKNDIPVWYKEETILGRGVGNRDERKSHASNNLTQRLGAWFLSTRIHGEDKMSRDLRADLKQLANNPEVPVRPSSSRGTNDIITRIPKLNNGDSVKVVMDRVRKIEEDSR